MRNENPAAGTPGRVKKKYTPFGSGGLIKGEGAVDRLIAVQFQVVGM